MASSSSSCLWTVVTICLSSSSLATAQRFDLSSLSLRAAVRDGAFGCPGEKEGEVQEFFALVYMFFSAI